ncbi:MAG: RrF2 family transcriptional regulator [Candidatus Kapaibacterium sp.]
MIFSRASEYAIQAMLYLAKRTVSEGKKVVQTREIADAHGIPYHFLAKIVQDLAKADLIISLKGPNGGIGLAHSASNITVLEIVRSVDNIQYVTDCVVGYDKCNSENPCPLHHDWEKIREIIFNLIREKKLADLIDDTEFVNGRLLRVRNVSADKTAPAKKVVKKITKSTASA